MIFKKRLQSKFTAVSNAVCTDTSISTEARWCLWYLLTKPQDWEVRLADIRQSSGWGRDKAKNVINELVSARYVVKHQERAGDGAFDVNRYDVYEEPLTNSPLTEKPSTIEPVSANTSLTKDLKIPRTEKLQNTEKYISSGGDFDAFWAVYPKRPNNPKAAAKAKYEAARKAGVSHETILSAAKAYAATRKGEDPIYTAMAVTWLNQKRWDCEFSVEDEAQSISDADYDMLAKSYPWKAADQAEAKRIASGIVAGGVAVHDLTEAARKYALLVKDRRYEGFDESPVSLEKWLRFKWRDMGEYEYRRVGMDNRLTVRPKKATK